MHKNPFWITFLVAITLTVFWFTGSSLYKYYQYANLDSSVIAKHTLWSIHHQSSDVYLLKADYSFVVDNQEYSGNSLLHDPSFRNPWAAESTMKQYTQKPWTVWYSSKNINNSSLEHKLPWKEIISAGILWVLLAYFIGLGYYVARF